MDQNQKDETDRIAVTRLGSGDKPDHTTYSAGDLRRSYDSDKGENVRNDHIAVNGERGSAVDREPEEKK